MQQQKSFASDLKGALIAGVVGLILLTPIAGLVLDGYEVRPELERAIYFAIAVFAGRMVLSGLTRLRSARASSETKAKPEGGLSITQHWIFVAATVIVSAALPFLVGKYWLTVLILALIYVLLGLGLNIVVGLAGLLDLGFVAFYAVGAYGYALGAEHFGLSFWAAIPMCALLAALFGAVLGFPVLRMHGDYLAIVTLGFGEIIRLVLNNWIELTGGPNGMSAPFPKLFGMEFSRSAKDGGTPFHEAFGLAYSNEYKYMFLYLVLLVVVCFMVWFLNRLRQMAVGRAWEALREDEIACRSLGINHVTVKLTAFSTGAMVGGVAGVFFAAYQGFINPTSFTFFESALILAIVVLGGLGSTVGVIMAALFMAILPEALRDFAEYRVLVFGILMVVMMIWRPRGLLQAQRKKFTRQEAIP